ncbi:MAG: 4-hydroxy-tetrahydrodipicolinate reductase [Rikenellaceae bacterium]
MNIAIIGYGKMGREIEKILISRGHNIGLIIDIDNAEDLNSEKLSAIDVAIEFSAPSAAYQNIVKCIECGTPVVCGTTAWLDSYDDVVKLTNEKEGAFFYASNYSIGVNLFFDINRRLSNLMNSYPQYDVTLEEVHHTQKKDAPSGTAITLAEGILEGIERKTSWVCKPTTEPEELEVAAIRRSVVPGTHTITWESSVDMITIQHLAKGREGFALGAVVAAEFLCGKRGIFTMSDLLAQS